MALRGARRGPRSDALASADASGARWIAWLMRRAPPVSSRRRSVSKATCGCQPVAARSRLASPTDASVGTQARRIDLDPRRDARQREQAPQQVADAASDAARDVVGAGRHARVEQRADRRRPRRRRPGSRAATPDCRPAARLAASRPDLRRLAREARARRRGLARPRVVERAHPHHVESGRGVARGQQVGTCLRARVRRARRSGALSRRAGRPAPRVPYCSPEAEQQARARRPPRRGLEQRVRAQIVDARVSSGCASETPTELCPARWMIASARARRRPRATAARCRGRGRRRRPASPLREPRHELAPDETGGSRDEARRRRS